MRSAGCQKGDGHWRRPDGEPFSLTLLATADDEPVATEIVDQLTDWGLRVELVTEDQRTYDDRALAGDWDLSMRGWWVNHGLLWYRIAIQSGRRHRFGTWSDAFVEHFVTQHENVESVDYSSSFAPVLEGWTPEQLKAFTLPAPPVGEPAKAPKNYPVAWLGWSLRKSLDDDVRRARRRKLAWVFNWYLPYLPLGVEHDVALHDERD